MPIKLPFSYAEGQVMLNIVAQLHSLYYQASSCRTGLQPAYSKLFASLLTGLLGNHLWLPGQNSHCNVPNVKDLRLSSHVNIMCSVSDPTALPHCSRMGEWVINSFVDQVCTCSWTNDVTRGLTKSETILQFTLKFEHGVWLIGTVENHGNTEITETVIFTARCT